MWCHCYLYSMLAVCLQLGRPASGHWQNSAAAEPHAETLITVRSFSSLHSSSFLFLLFEQKQWIKSCFYLICPLAPQTQPADTQLHWLTVNWFRTAAGTGTDCRSHKLITAISFQTVKRKADSVLFRLMLFLMKPYLWVLTKLQISPSALWYSNTFFLFGQNVSLTEVTP